MADKIQTLLVSLEARINQYEATMRKAMAVTNASAKKIETRFKQLNTNLGSSFGGLGGLIGKAFAGAAALRGAQVLIDASTRIENSLKVAGLAGEELSRVYDRLFASAQKNAAPLESLVELYGRAALVQKDLGVTTEELLGFTDNIAVALRVSGKSASESSGALLQLSQALGSGTVRAEEFNSILEGALPIAQAAAAGLKEAGGSVAKLRQLVVDGKISSEAFFRAFEAGSATLSDKVAGSTFTVAQQFEQLRTVLIDAAGKFDDATGASKATASGLNQLAAAIQNLGDYFERNAGRIKPFFDAIAAADSFDPVAFRKQLGLGAIDDFLDGVSLIEGRFDFASRQVAARAEEMGAALGDFEYAIREVALASQGVVSEEASEKILALAGDLFAGKVSADDAKKALLDLGTAEPDTSGITSRLVALVATLDAVRNGAVSAFNAAASVSGTPASFAGQDTYKPPKETISLAKYPPPAGAGGAKKSPGEKFAESLEDQRQRTRFLEEETATLAALGPLMHEELALIAIFSERKMP